MCRESNIDDSFLRIMLNVYQDDLSTIESMRRELKRRREAPKPYHWNDLIDDISEKSQAAVLNI